MQTRAVTLPTGTVTFMFTDIEGSTALLQQLGDDYGSLLAQHCQIVRDAITGAGGTEISTEGDSFFAVFPSATDALRASADAQRGLAAAPWPKGASVRVRMGLHTGEGRLGGESYIGIDVHRAARIAAAGHGGQVLLSDATRSLVEPTLPADLALRDLGGHRLKDLVAPEHLYQLDIPELEQSFPALRSLDARPNNLPAQLSSFVGRDEAIGAVHAALDAGRLVTLTGPGGSGKTRLALEVAAGRLDQHADGVFFVELAPISDPDLVPAAIAAVVGIRESAGRPLRETLAEGLRDRQTLLVLDNFEQVTDAAVVVGELLVAAPGLTILVTSRTVLRIRGEREFAVPPLTIPDPAHLPALEALSHYEGVALFLARAMDARPDFQLSAGSAPAVAEIIARLDGLPLAIELAAAKTRVLTPEAILGRLGSRLAFLDGGARDLPARQRTLRDTIDWSHSLLPDAERVLLRRLAIFVGGWTAEAATTVADPSDVGLDTVEGLEALLDQSLIRRIPSTVAPDRFGMLETIREYALERLTDSTEAGAIAAQHAAYFTSLAELIEPRLQSAPEAIAQLEAEHDNCRTALAWAIEHGDAALGLRLGYALWRFWQQRGHLAEGHDWFARLLALPMDDVPPAIHARGLNGAAGIAYWQNDYAQAAAWYADVERIVRQLGDEAWLTDAIYNSASVAMLQGDAGSAMAQMSEALEIARHVGDDEIVARIVAGQGYLAFMIDELDQARSLLEESLALAERSKEPVAVGIGHHTVAQVARLQGRYDDAIEHYAAAVRVGHEFGDDAALSEPLQGLAAVAVATGDAETGVRLLGANAAIRERLGGGPPPEWLRLGTPLEDARATLSPEAYDRAWAEGLAMTTDEAVAHALEAVGGRRSAKPAARS
jgi:predicted ATPase/class 3 adenylate cyclase